MPHDNTEHLLAFVQIQRELMQLQMAEIEAGDYPAAISTGVKLNAAKGEWAIIIEAVKAGAWDETTRATVRSTVNEMLTTHEHLMSILEPARDKVADMITDVKRGRQLLTGYRLTKRGHRLQFETQA